MKKSILYILAMSITQFAIAQKLDRSIIPAAGPAPEIKLSEAQKFTLDNGLKVFVVENHKTPQVTVSLNLDIDPELQGNMAGLHEFVGEMISAGTKTLPKDQFDKAVDMIGASLNANVGGFSGRTLTRHMDRFFQLASDMILNPAFPSTEMDKLKTQFKSALLQGKDDPNTILNNVSSVVNYGKNHPYGEIMTEKTLENITLDAVKKFHSTYFKPNVGYMVIVGDITMKQAQDLTKKYFGNWKKGTVPAAKYPEIKPVKGVNIYAVNKSSAVQSAISVGAPVKLPYGNIDVIKSRVANEILGGGSQGRLFLNLREQHAWTYGAYSSINPDDIIGIFDAGGSVKNVATDSAIVEILKEMDALATGDVDAQRLQDIKNNMTGKFAMSLENPATVARQALYTEMYNMPKDYYKNYLKNLAAVNAADVKQMAKTYMDAKNTNVIVVGNLDEILPGLEKLGKVTILDAEGNPAELAKKEMAPAGLTAETIYSNYVNAIGGEKAINAIKDIKIVREAELQGQKLTITSSIKAPTKLKEVVSMMGMELQKKVVNGDKGYQSAQGQKMDLTPEELKAAHYEANPAAMLKPKDYGYTLTLKGKEGNNYIIEKVDPSGEKSLEYYDVNTHLLTQVVNTVETPNGPMTLTTAFSDYKPVEGGNGYKIPSVITIPLGPGMNAEAKVTIADINKGIADSEFE